MPKFRKKPVVIEAVQFRPLDNDEELLAFIGEDHEDVSLDSRALTLTIETLEGAMTAMMGDWIIRGVQGELYPCKPDIFEATYEPAD